MIADKDKEILDALKDRDGKISAAKTNKDYLKKHGYYDYLINRYSDNTITDCIPEILYRLANDIDTPPTCKMCGNPIKFSMSGRLYAKHCSAKCRNNDPEVKKKNAEGVSKYRTWEYANKKEEVMAKKAATLKKHYGEDNNGSPFCCKAVTEKAQKTCFERYGSKGYIIDEETRKKSNESNILRAKQMWKERGFDVSYTDHKTVIVHNGCHIHGDIELSQWNFNNRMKPSRLSISPLCPICNPLNINNGIEDFVGDVLEDAGVTDVLKRTRKIVKGKELDFYIPELNAAIEANGVYFHSVNNNPDTKYHVNKTDMCESNGIRVMHIWEHFIRYKSDLSTNEILRYINKLPIVKGERILHMENDDAELFFTDNCLYGYKEAVNSLCLCGKGGTVLSAISYNFNNNIVEIINYHDRNDIKCENSFHLFIEYIKNNEHPSEIIYSVSRDIYDKKMIEENGFVLDSIKNGYKYVFRCSHAGVELQTKMKLEISEHDYMKNESEKTRYYKCYDSGTATFKLLL